MITDSHKTITDCRKTKFDASELSYSATITKSPFINHFNGTDAGKVVYYWFRWENTRRETGPWSAAVAANNGE